MRLCFGAGAEISLLCDDVMKWKIRKVYGKNNEANDDSHPLLVWCSCCWVHRKWREGESKKVIRYEVKDTIFCLAVRYILLHLIPLFNCLSIYLSIYCFIDNTSHNNVKPYKKTILFCVCVCVILCYLKKTVEGWKVKRWWHPISQYIDFTLNHCQIMLPYHCYWAAAGSNMLVLSSHT